ncbi:unnamed protein product [Rotaria sordida]|uniref:Protein kinase domain-containing protein n=1 Tax=Rotaria sordida TaxID=392033 RepID=A0A813VTW5_9BILA|nr:unnamed protein product [Rotaria sordida]
MAILSKYKLEKYEFGTHIQKRQQLYGLSGKIIYEGRWTSGRTDAIIIVEMNEMIAEREARFYLEVNDHRNIIRTYGYVENTLNLTIFIQEFAELADLAGVLMDNQIPISQTILVEMFLQITDAMSYIASNKIVHCDLGCRNVLVFRLDSFEAKNNLVKITDFGLARWIDQPPPNEKELIIPIRFCAPEILRNNHHSNYSEKSDVYSMGVLMWEALSNSEIPYSSIAEDDDVIQKKLNNEKLKKPTDCDHQLWVLMNKCWHEDPEQRPTFDEINNKLSYMEVSKVQHHQTSDEYYKTRIKYDYKLNVHVQIKGSSNRQLPAIHQAEWKTDETSSIVLIEKTEELSESEKLLYTTYNKHDHIVYTYGFVENNRGSIMILQEKAPHGNLRELLDSSQFNPSPQVLIEIFSQILNAMIHITDQELVHGDLRCENVLVFKIDSSEPKRNLVKLTNFSLAHENDPALVDDRRLSIPVRYCAPEIIRSAGRSNYSDMSDVYSMGVLMWQACSNGKLPYESSTKTSEVRQRKLNGEILPKPFICDKQIWDIMKDCWLNEPNIRFNFKEMKRRFSNINHDFIETYKYELNVNVKQLRQLNGRFYKAQWIPKKEPSIVLMTMNEETAEREASFYMNFKSHPNIIDTFGFVKNDHRLIKLLQEEAPYGDLETLLQKGNFQPSEKVLVAIFLQITEAMIYIANQKIVHGDLRCANVLVFQMDSADSKRNSVKLTNFSMMCPIDHPVSTRRVREDLIQYYAPEIRRFDNQSKYTEFSDVYSMGILMWQACSNGTIPIKRRTTNGDIQQKPKDCNDQLWSVIEMCYCDEPTIRLRFREVNTQLLKISFDETRPIFTNDDDDDDTISKTPKKHTSSEIRIHFTRCKYCGERCLGSQLTEHKQTCSSRTRPIFIAHCDYCGQQCLSDEKLAHEQSCPMKIPATVHQSPKLVRSKDNNNDAGRNRRRENKTHDRPIRINQETVASNPQQFVRLTQCRYCHREYSSADIRKHGQSCPLKPPQTNPPYPLPVNATCRYCYGQLPQNAIQAHENTCRPSPPTRSLMDRLCLWISCCCGDN